MNLSRRDYLLLLLLGGAAFFAHNTVLSPDIMECRNMVAAREMVLDGHWLLPTLNGSLRLEKPPLPTWLTALTWYLRPGSVALQRGMAGLAGLLLVFGLYDTVRQLRGRRAALLSSVILLTCYNVVLMGRTASWDIYCHAFVMASLPAQLRALRGERVWRNSLLAGFLLGLSFLSKGPISLYGLWLPFLLGLFAGERALLRVRWWPALTGLLVCLVVGTWWYAYVHWAASDAMGTVVERETGNWTRYNMRPWWYYWRFWLESGIWSPLALWAVLWPVVGRLCRRRVSRSIVLPWVWTLGAVVLLSLFPEKKMRYLLPVMLPLSMLMGVWLSEARGWWERPVRVGRFRPSRASCVVGGVAVLFFVVEVGFFPLVGHWFGNPVRRSIAEARSDARLAGVPFYHDARQLPRPEVMWASGGIIRFTDFTCVDSLASHLPCAVLTHDPPAAALPAGLWQCADSLCLGRFDDNTRAPSYPKRYSPVFIYHVTLLTPKP